MRDNYRDKYQSNRKNEGYGYRCKTIHDNKSCARIARGMFKANDKTVSGASVELELLQVLSSENLLEQE
jgi:hypothetical protein